jgi:hypothetical protein
MLPARVLYVTLTVQVTNTEGAACDPSNDNGRGCFGHRVYLPAGRMDSLADLQGELLKWYEWVLVAAVALVAGYLAARFVQITMNG